MSTPVAQMTTDELRALIEATVEQTLLELFDYPEARLVLKKPLRDRLSRQQTTVATGERGEGFSNRGRTFRVTVSVCCTDCEMFQKP